MAFYIHYNLYKYLVKPFRLANIPSSFKYYINDTSKAFLDIFSTAYLDDILIYSKTLKDHQEYICLVLQALRKASLYTEIEKC